MSKPVYGLSKMQFIIKEYRDKNGHRVNIGSRLRNNYGVKFLIIEVGGIIYLTDDREDKSLGKEYNIEVINHLIKLRDKK